MAPRPDGMEMNGNDACVALQVDITGLQSDTAKWMNGQRRS